MNVRPAISPRTCQAQGIGARTSRPSCATKLLPHAPDAWYVLDCVIVGYEISFNDYSCEPKALRPPEQTRADLLAVDEGAEGLLAWVKSGDTQSDQLALPGRHLCHRTQTD